MEEQDKFNQPNVNEPIKQSVEQQQPAADVDGKSTVDATAQSTSDETEDAEIVEDPKRPECPSTKYYREYWIDPASVLLIVLSLIAIISNLLIDITEGNFDRASILACIFAISIIIPSVILMLMTRSAFRWRKPEALFLRVSQSVYTLLVFSCWLGRVLAGLKDDVISAESGKFDFYGLFAIEYSKAASYITSILYQTIVLLAFVGISLGGLYACTDKELKRVFPSDKYMNTSQRGFWTVIGIMSLPIVVFIMTIIIAHG